MAARAPRGLGRKLARGHLLDRVRGAPPADACLFAAGIRSFRMSGAWSSIGQGSKAAGPFAAGEMRSASATLAPRDQRPYKANSPAL
jgi:hypothetical protein